MCKQVSRDDHLAVEEITERVANWEDFNILAEYEPDLCMVYRTGTKNARYINGQKFEDWLRASGSNSLRVLKGEVSGTNLNGHKVLTEADLVNTPLANNAVNGDPGQG